MSSPHAWRSVPYTVVQSYLSCNKVRLRCGSSTNIFTLTVTYDDKNRSLHTYPKVNLEFVKFGIVTIPKDCRWQLSSNNDF